MGKKEDDKRIALTQKHERAYLRKIARELIGYCEADQKHSKKLHLRSFVTFFKTDKMSTSLIKRIAKALLKCLDKI